MKRLFQILTIIPVIIMLFIIFGFSAESAEESSLTSEIVVKAVAEAIIKDFDELPKEQSKSIIAELTHYIRKLAHFSEFALFGLFTALHFFVSSIISYIPLAYVLPISWTLGSVVALSDELHQLFVPGRGCRVEDMMIDSIGSLTGVLILLLFVIIFIRSTQKCNMFKGE